MADGKLYPPDGQLPEPVFRRAVNMAPRLRCRDHMSYRRIVAALESEGIRASIGSVHAWIRRFSCKYEPGDG